MSMIEGLSETTTITVPMHQLLEVLQKALPYSAVRISDHTVASMKLEVYSRLEEIGVGDAVTARIVGETFGDPMGQEA